MKLLIGSLGKALAFIITILPQSVRQFLGAALGIVWFDILRIRRNTAIENVRIAYSEKSEKEIKALARASLVNMGRTIVEYGLISFYQSGIAPRNFKVEGEENIRAAMAEGKGVIMLTLHLGNGDLACAELARMGYPIHLISKEFTTKWLNELWFGMRERLGIKFIGARRSSFDILKALKKNEIVIFVLDQFMGPPLGVRTQFFGKETGTAMGCAIMAERTHSPVIPTYTYRRADGSPVLVFDKAVPYLDDGPRDQNIATMTQKYTDKIESIIRLHPGQWMWIHRRWKEFRE